VRARIRSTRLVTASAEVSAIPCLERAKKGSLMRVFIADDSEVVAERLKTMLSELPGIEIAGQARDAPEATKSILETEPDVVILDIRMPMGSGIEVLREIKQRKTATTVIMLTNYPYPQYRKRCLDAGADFFLDKSGEFNKIIGILEKLLESSSQCRG